MIMIRINTSPVLLSRSHYHHHSKYTVLRVFPSSTHSICTHTVKYMYSIQYIYIHVLRCITVITIIANKKHQDLQTRQQEHLGPNNPNESNHDSIDEKMFSTYPEQDYQDGMKSDILKKENLGKQRNHKTTEIVGCFCLLFLGLQPAPGI